MEKFNPAKAIYEISNSEQTRGVNPSISDSATFFFPTAKQMTATFHGEDNSFLYSRHWNPTNKMLADTLARMEDTPAAWVTGSGMSAITTTILQLCNSGDHIISSITVYGGTFAFFSNWLKKVNIEVTFVDITDLDAVRNAIKENTKVIYTESLTNPLLQVSDIPELSKIAKEHNLKLVVDNTFTPMIISPSRLGADVTVYSLTKFVNGKNDCVAGAICGTEEFINSLIDLHSGTAMLLGPVLEPMRAASIYKNIFTLHIRMRQHSHNASYIAKKFKETGLRTIYPGLEDDKGYEVMLKIKNHGFGYGGMVAIDLDTVEKASKFIESLQEKGIGYLAVSLGYFKTLFSNSGSSTSSEVPIDVQKKMGLSPGLVRFSFGLDDNIEEIWEVIHQTLIEQKLI